MGWEVWEVEISDFLNVEISDVYGNIIINFITIYKFDQNYIVCM